MAYQYYSAKNCIRLIALIIFVAVVIVDFIYDDYFLRNSAGLSLSL